MLLKRSVATGKAQLSQLQLNQGNGGPGFDRRAVTYADIAGRKDDDC
jgi:hypothetical protein